MVPGPDHDLVAAIEEDQRVIAGVVPGRGVRIRRRLGQDPLWIRGVAEAAGAGENVGERVAPGLDLEPLPLTGRDRHVEVARIGGHPFDGPPLAPELTADDAHGSPIIISDLGDGARRDVLIPRVRHLQGRGQIGPELKAVHPALRIAPGHLLM